MVVLRKATIKKFATLHCTFCRKRQHEVRRLIGPKVFVCNECIDIMHETNHADDKKAIV